MQSWGAATSGVQLILQFENEKGWIVSNCKLQTGSSTSIPCSLCLAWSGRLSQRPHNVSQCNPLDKLIDRCTSQHQIIIAYVVDTRAFGLLHHMLLLISLLQKLFAAAPWRPLVLTLFLRFPFVFFLFINMHFLLISTTAPATVGRHVL